MKNKRKISTEEAIKAISSERKRTNILRKAEERALAYLVQRIPSWISSNILTAIGFCGNFLVFLSFVFAKYIDRYFLLLGVLGFMISWFGDSLDGRIAYYRNKPRKWFGFALDITVDWIGILSIGLGFMIFMDEPWMYIGYAFIVLYAWEAFTSLIRYKITDRFSIDSGIFGPTELRIIISAVLIIELIFSGSIIYFGILTVLLLIVTNIKDALDLLDHANKRDAIEKEKAKKE